MIWIAFSFIVISIIGAGTLILKLAEISKTDRGNRSWIWGVITLIALIVVPLLVLGIMVKFGQYAELKEVFGRFYLQR